MKKNENVTNNNQTNKTNNTQGQNKKSSAKDQKSPYKKFHEKVHHEIRGTLKWIMKFFVDRGMDPVFAEKFFLGFLLFFFEIVFTMFILVGAVLLYWNIAPKVRKHIRKFKEALNNKRDTD